MPARAKVGSKVFQIQHQHWLLAEGDEIFHLIGKGETSGGKGVFKGGKFDNITLLHDMLTCQTYEAKCRGPAPRVIFAQKLN